MLKKLWLFAIFVWSLLAWSTYAAGPIQSEVVALETEIELWDSTIYTNISYRPVRQILEAQCSERSLVKGKRITDAAAALVEKRYGSNGAYLLTDTQELYTLITRLQKKTATYDDEKYCATKYVLNTIQLKLREIHLGYMEDTWLIDEFDWVNELDPVINGFDAKAWIIQQHIDAYRTSVSNVWSVIQARILNPEFLDTLTPQQEVLTQKAQWLMEVILAQAMIDLRERKFLTQDEINDLSGKIQYEYVAACGVFNGKYEIKQTFRNDELIDQAPNSLTLKVNLCPSYFVIRDLPEIYQKIITHELGHHVYYFRDQQTDQFADYCWNGDKNRNGSCMSDDFVTSYAQTSALEDYAEHFMYWFLGLDHQNTQLLRTKDDHFDRLESKM